MKSFKDYFLESNHQMDPRDHAVERNGKFVVVDKDGETVKTFDDKEAAEKYAVANHDKLMEGCGCDGTNEDVSSKDAGRIGAAISNRKDLPASEKNVARRSLQRKVARAQRREKAFNVNADSGSRYRVGTKRPTDDTDPKHKGLRRNDAIAKTLKSYGTNEDVEQVDEAMYKGMDPKAALKVYNKLKKGDKVAVEFSAVMSSTKDPLELVVSSPHRIVGKSKVGRIILKNPNNMRGMKYTLYNRDGKVSLAQGDMATIMTDLSIVNESVMNECWDTHVQRGNKTEESVELDELKMPKGGLEKGTFKNPALMLKLLTTGGKGKRKRKVEEEKKDKIKVKLDPKKKIGYEVRSVGPGGKTNVTKRRDMPGQEDVGEASAAWQRKEGKNKEGGLNAAGRASYERENPGSDLKAPVSAEQAKKSKGGKAAKRRKSFCARMGGMPGPMKDEKGRPTRKALALRKWDC